ncbi:APC family permease [Sphingomonas flavescens]|uniref:APC family permease n=1 Tax=Sphingomonas flavescens TaxID=3132797 RepID=UPI002806102F|nr:amino acid permease [Sphingomonas limnosediminicola]
MTDHSISIDTHPEPASRMLGKWMSAAMVVGTMVGSGIYLLPTTLAPYGYNLVIAFLLTGFGTMCLAFCLARLAAQIPGGPFAYVTEAFGETAAFLTLWSYVVSQITGVAGVAVAIAGALSHVVPQVGSGPGLIAVALGSIVILSLVNLRGARSAGVLQVIATLIKIVPLLAVVLFVLVRLGTGQPLEPLEPTPINVSAITIAGALMLFSLTGFEAAAVTANVTRDSTSTVPTATIVGTGFTAVIYLLSTVATLMLLPSALAAKSGAPFADAIAPILGPLAGAVVAVIAAISAFGTANALLLFAAEISRTIAGARDLPPVFRKTNRVGAPVGAILIVAAISALLVLASSSKNFVALYVFITLVSTVAALVLYIVCAAAALKLKVVGRWAIIAVIGVFYSIAMFIGAGLEATLWGFGLALIGLPIRAISRWLNGSSRSAEASPTAPRG